MWEPPQGGIKEIACAARFYGSARHRRHLVCIRAAEPGGNGRHRIDANEIWTGPIAHLRGEAIRNMAGITNIAARAQAAGWPIDGSCAPAGDPPLQS
jgi:hypothetical protein